MISVNEVHARIRRKKIREHAGANFVEPFDIINRIPCLSQFGDELFLFGIHESIEKWTVLSLKNLFGCYKGQLSRISLKEGANEVHDYFGREGNKYASDIDFNDGRKIWMMSPEVSSGFQNIILMLQVFPD